MLSNEQPINTYISHAVHYGLLNVHELLNEKGEQSHLVKDEYINRHVPEIIQAINKYPLTYLEVIQGYIDNGEWTKLENYKLTFDSVYAKEAYKEIFNSDVYKTKNKTLIKGLFKGPYNKHIEAKIPKRYMPNNGDWWASSNELEKTKKVKEKIIEDLQKTYGVYTESKTLDYGDFYKLLEKGEYQKLVVELCKRMEDRLKKEYKYRGTLMELLKQYVKMIETKHGDSKNAKAIWTNLSKLIRCRNNLVHNEDNGEQMSIDELKQCIDYVVKI